jgi:hypothetical protein
VHLILRSLAKEQTLGLVVEPEADVDQDDCDHGRMQVRRTNSLGLIALGVDCFDVVDAGRA